MKVSKSSGTQGAWLKKEDLTNGDILKLVSEARDEEGQNGTQLVAKCRIKGQGEEAINVAINKPSKNALIEAFGDDTKNWVEKHLTINVEKGIFAGRRGIALYLLPEGFELKEDDGGYLVIVNTNAEKIKKEDTTPEDENIKYPEEEIDPKDQPF